MLANIAALIHAAEQLKLKYQVEDEFSDVVCVHKGTQKLYFVQSSTPFNDEAVRKLARDKDYTHKLLEKHTNIPWSKSFFDPDAPKTYDSYKQTATQKEILKNILTNFDLPVVLKPNSGLKGKHVFLCRTEGELNKVIARIFNKQDKSYDFMLIAQRMIKIRHEYRVLCVNGQVELYYEKPNSKYSQWFEKKNTSKIRIGTDKTLQTKLQEFFDPIYRQIPIHWAGIDVALDEGDKLWLIELNTSPGFEQLVKDVGIEELAEVYKKVLTSAVIPA
jgi:glutathione synthase/RimK-type ligase-like ATP-grasp enzyme